MNLIEIIFLHLYPDNFRLISHSILIHFTRFLDRFEAFIVPEMHRTSSMCNCRYFDFPEKWASSSCFHLNLKNGGRDWLPCTDLLGDLDSVRDLFPSVLEPYWWFHTAIYACLGLSKSPPPPTPSWHFPMFSDLIISPNSARTLLPSK